MASESVQSAAYPTIEQVMVLARSIVNDAFQNGAGRILTDNAAFTVPYLNSAIRWLQDLIANSGVSSNIKDNFLMLNIAPVPSPDPSVQVVIGYTGYTIGTETFSAPALPPDLLVPLTLRERASGTAENFITMHSPQEGLPSCVQGAVFGMWEWRTDGIWMIGATVARDLQMRYEARLPLIGANANFATASAGIRDSTDALAYRVAWMYATARGAAQAPELELAAEKAAQQIVMRYARKDQRIQFHRKRFGRAQTGVPIGVYRG